MASWRDDLRECSFRGVRARYQRAAVSRGRRVAVHEYPNSEQADLEDLGAKTPEFSLNLFLLDSEEPGTLNARRDRLLQALEQPGPGTLIHPYYGAIDVQVNRVHESYSTRDGGMVRLRVQFYRVEKRRAPVVSTDTQRVLKQKTDALQDAAIDDFDDGWSIDGWNRLVRQAAHSVIESAYEALFVATGAINQIDDVMALPGDLENEIMGLLDSGRALAEHLFRARSLLGSDDTDDVYSYDGDATFYGSGTASIQRQTANRDATIILVRVITITSALGGVTDTDFASADDALDMRDDLLGKIDELAGSVGDATYRELLGARIALVDDIDKRAGKLPQLTAYTPTDTTPAVVLGWQLYADPARGDEIARRNDVVHPGFVPGGDALEVLDA